MSVSLFFYLILGLGLFYLHELVLFPQVYIRPLAPLIFYVSLKEPLAPAFTLAVFLGLLQDSYALAPFGIHLFNCLVLVGLARLARQTFWVKRSLFLILALTAALVFQDLVVFLLLAVLESWEVFSLNASWPRGIEIMVTALLTPVFFSLIRTLEFQWRRLRRPAGSTPLA
ncbi:MAG: rod shape-determining protein MreD [Desulfobaccales bacterium]